MTIRVTFGLLTAAICLWLLMPATGLHAQTPSPDTKPGAPAITQVTSGDGELTVAWSPPGDGGSAITGWTVVWYPVGHFDERRITAGIPAAARTWTIEGLTNGARYFVTVAAVNDYGTGPDAVAKGKPAGLPGAPAIPAMGGSDRTLSVTWDAPANDGGADVTGYRVRWREAGSEAWTTVDAWKGRLWYIISGLVNDVSYEAQVAAVNAAGRGAFSASAQAAPYAPTNEPPGAPTGLQAAAGDRQLALTWTAPGNTGGGSPVAGYDVQYRRGAAPGAASGDPEAGWTPWSHSGSGTSAIVTGLVQGYEYDVRVRARNSFFAGEWALASGTSYGPPHAPDRPWFSAGRDRRNVERLTLTWPEPNDGGAEVSGYYVYWQLEGEDSVSQSSLLNLDSYLLHRSFNMDFPPSGRTLLATVTAVNRHGESEPSQPGKYTRAGGL